MPEVEFGDVRFPPRLRDVQKAKWRNAGPLSHQKSCAALAYLLHDCRFNFVNAEHAWAGTRSIMTMVTIITIIFRGSGVKQ